MGQLNVSSGHQGPSEPRGPTPMGIQLFLPQKWEARGRAFGVSRKQDRRALGVGMPGAEASSLETRMAKSGCKQEPGATPASTAHRLRVFLATDKSFPDVKRKGHVIPPGFSCPEALSASLGHPFPTPAGAQHLALPGPQSGSHRHTLSK